jgi:hypothetical protein
LRRRHCAALALFLVAAAAAQESDRVRALPDCGSVVVVKCEPTRTAVPLPPSASEAARRDQSRTLAARRENSTAQDLGWAIIEGEAIRRRTLEEAFSPAFPQVRPVDGTYTFTIAESAQCTCMNRCPPPPFPCCQCSGHMNRYSTSPGASVLR